MEKNLLRYRIINCFRNIVIGITIIISLFKSFDYWNDSLYMLGIWLIILSIGTIITSFSSNVSYTNMDFLMFGGLGYCLVLIAFHPNTPSEHYIVYYIFSFLLYTLLRIVFSTGSISVSTVEYIFMLASLFEILSGYSQLIRGQSNSVLFPVTGNYNNPGPYSAYIVIGVVIAMKVLHSIFYEKKMSKRPIKAMIIPFIIIVFGIIMLFIVFSRDALLCVTVFALKIFRPQFKKHKKHILLLGILSISIVIYLKFGSFIGRFFNYYIALRLFVNNPFFGSGIGTMAEEYGIGLREYFSNNLNNMLFNINYLDYSDVILSEPLIVLVEQGVFGIIICAGICYYCYKGLGKFSISILYGYEAFMLFSIFSYQFEYISYHIVIVVFIALSTCMLEKKKEDFPIYITLIYSTLCLCISFCFVNYTNTTIETKRMVSSLFGTNDSSVIKYYYKYYNDNQDDIVFLNEFSRILMVNHLFKDANAVLKNIVKITNNPNYYTVIGDNYMELGDYTSALKNYKKSFYTLPNRMTPLYKEMILYKKINKRTALYYAALKVAKFQPKIKNAETEKMRSEAIEVLKCINK